jgi:hypothetical protein
MKKINYFKSGEIAYFIQTENKQGLQINVFKGDNFNPGDFEFRNEKYIGSGKVSRERNNCFYFWNDKTKGLRLNERLLREYFKDKKNIKLEIR